MPQQAHQSFQWDSSKLHFEFPIPNRETRLKGLVLYISHQCLDDPTFSRTKLYKILFYSDFEAYGRFRKPITGIPYKKFSFGPAPASFIRLQDEMLRDHLIRVVKRRVFDTDRLRVLPLEDPEPAMFNGAEISIVEAWIRFFWNKTAKEVSRYSHGLAWKLATLGGPIPYDAVFISDERVTFDEVERVKELAILHGWKT
jgi:Antitoxin SocA-like, Panacea domain